MVTTTPTSESPRPGEAATTIRSALTLIARSLAGLAFGLLCADALVGAFGGESGPQGNSSVMVLDAQLGWTNRPGFAEGSVTTNALGLRSPEVPPGAPDTEVRIVVTGASNVFGLAEPDEETWGPKLEALLAAEVAPPPRVLNAGVQGYSIIQCCRRAARLIDLLDPDLVVVVVIPARQGLVDTSPAQAWTRVHGKLVPTDLVERWPASLRGLPAGAHRMLLSSHLYRRFRSGVQLRAGVGPKLTEFVLTDAATPEVIARSLDDVRQEISELVAFAQERGVALRFAPAIGTRNSNPERWRTYLEDAAAKGAPPVGTPMTEPLEALARLVQEAGADTWDMGTTLFAIGSDWEENVNDRLHWSPKGHRLVAMDWARKLLDTGLLARLSAERSASPRQVSPALEAILEGAPGR